jgi:ferritin-like metal-binding protein YciE
MSGKELLADWLNDVLEREHALLHNLETYARSVDQSDPELYSVLIRHAERTRAHMSALGDAIARLGEKSDKKRTTIITETLANAVATIPRDSALRRVTDLWAAVQDILIRYAAIVAAARSVSEADTAMAAESFLEEDRLIADWLEDYIPETAKELIASADD